MGERDVAVADQADALLALYDSALPQVYGYVLRRCSGAAQAEDLTAEVFLAAASAVQRGTVPDLTPAWLIGVARHKLVDHWRRQARDERVLQAVAEAAPDEDDWTEALEEGPALAALSQLGAHHRAALTLRHLDGLPVAEVAEHLGRTLHATEALLVRARVALRTAYHREGDRG